MKKQGLTGRIAGQAAGRRHDGRARVRGIGPRRAPAGRRGRLRIGPRRVRHARRHTPRGPGGGRAFYIEGGADGGITPIDHACAADDAARVHRHLAGAGIAAAGGVCRAAEPCSAGAPAAGGIADAGGRAAAIDSSAKTPAAAPATHWADGVPGARPAGRPCLARNGSTLPTSVTGRQRTKLSYEALLCLVL